VKGAPTFYLRRVANLKNPLECVFISKLAVACERREFHRHYRYVTMSQSSSRHRRRDLILLAVANSANFNRFERIFSVLVLLLISCTFGGIGLCSD
jgi:hypothetical protein